MNERTKSFTWRLWLPYRLFMHIHGGWFRNSDDGHWCLEIAVMTGRRAKT